MPLHYRGHGLEITVDGNINGKPSVMLVDTGADRIFLTRRGAARHRLALREDRSEVEGVGGVSRIYMADVEQFAIGPGNPWPRSISVLADTGDTPDYDGIAGAPFLLQMDMELALADKRLRLFKPEGCGDAFLGYWDRNAMVIPARSKRFDLNPRFKVEVNGVELDAIIDSGASTSSLTARAARSLGLDRPARRDGEEPGTVGVGKRIARTWTVQTRTIKIGNETILDAELGVIEPHSYMPFELVLGADFLRAHRVMFAISQNKLYLTYLGGDVISRHKTLEPWIRKEAEEGNTDAQMRVAIHYLQGRGVPRDEAEARTWIARAAAGGHIEANLYEGEALMKAGRHADAAARYDNALAKLDDGRYEALALYQARLGSGQQALGAKVLEERFARFDKQAWPGPIAEFYLGRSNRDALLAQAAADRSRAQARGCEAIEYMAALYRLQDRPDDAAPLAAQWQKACAAKPQ